MGAQHSQGNEFSEPDMNVDISAILDVLVRRKVLVLSIIGVALLLGVGVTAVMTPVYRAHATVVIETKAPNVLQGLGEVYALGSGGYWATRKYYETQYNIMNSVAVGDLAIATLGVRREEVQAELEAVTANVGGGEDFRESLPGQLREKLSLLGLEGFSARQALEVRLEQIDPTAELLAKVSIEPLKDSQLVHVVIEDTSPARASTLATALADAYVQHNIDQKVALTAQAVEWLGDQVGELKAILGASELALYEFKRSNNVVSMSVEQRQSMISETLSQLNRRLSETRANRLARRSRRDVSRRSRAKDALGAPILGLNEVSSDPLIQELKASRSRLRQTQSDLRLRYTPEHPKVLETKERLALVESELQAQVGTVLATLDGEYRVAVETEERLHGAINETKARALDLNRKEIEYTRLKRERDNNEELYALVLKREKEAELAQMLKVNNVRRLAEAALPSTPLRPRPLLNILIAVFLGTLLAVAASYLVESLNTSINSQADVERRLGLAFLGLVPSIRGDDGAKLKNPRERDHYLVEHPRSSVAECSRTIRTNLMFISPDEPLRSLMVTSTHPQEGKSTTVINLAITMAQSGARVLIVDTDMRRPRLHKSFDLDGTRGITNVILGDITLEAAIQNTGMVDVDLLGCGPVPPNPSELLHAASFEQIITDAKARYDRVIFDSPPVSAVTDAVVLGAMVDGTVLVVQAEETSWQAALNSKNRLAAVGGRVLGVVLNDVDLTSKGYGQYQQYYYYSRYSQNEDEVREAS